MTGTNTSDRKTTALLCIDFYNDFLSERGKLWPWVTEMAEKVNLLDDLRTHRPYRA
jgi:nicotinamidase-related amidase